MTREQVAERANVCTATIAAWVRDRGLKQIQFSKRLTRFRASDVDDFLNKMRSYDNQEDS